MPTATPLQIDGPVSLKRDSTAANLDAPAAKRQNRGPVRHHQPTWRPSAFDQYQTTPQDGESVSALLERAIILALEAVGFTGVDPGALQAFRLEAEEYMLHFLGDVTQTMLSSRRVQPIPADFLQSLHTHQLLLTSLLPHLNPPVPPEKSQIKQPLEADEQTITPQEPSLDLFSDSKATAPYIPQHFPPLPSEHTYKATPDMPVVERDPRRIRELVAEEGRLGEAALRKLFGGSSDMSISTTSGGRETGKSMRARRDDAWKEAMQAATLASTNNLKAGISRQDLGLGGRHSPADGAVADASAYLSTSVNAGKQYWRKPANRRIPKASANETAP